MNELSQIIYLLGNFGFPVAISVYLLFRFEKRFEELESAIDDLSESAKTKLQPRPNPRILGVCSSGQHVE